MLRLAVRDAELSYGVIAHEPPLFHIIADDRDSVSVVEVDETMTATVADNIASGDHKGGAKRLIEFELGPGSRSELPPDFLAISVENPPSFLDEARDPSSTPPPRRARYRTRFQEESVTSAGANYLVRRDNPCEGLSSLPPW